MAMSWTVQPLLRQRLEQREAEKANLQENLQSNLLHSRFLQYASVTCRHCSEIQTGTDVYGFSSQLRVGSGLGIGKNCRVAFGFGYFPILSYLTVGVLGCTSNLGYHKEHSICLTYGSDSPGRNFWPKCGPFLKKVEPSCDQTLLMRYFWFFNCVP